MRNNLMCISRCLIIVLLFCALSQRQRLWVVLILIVLSKEVVFQVSLEKVSLSCMVTRCCIVLIAKHDAFSIRFHNRYI
ncbi:unnamed protein product [Linum tenue]|uniref:Secreted protein n=1 Tax=Linum tenue TaxID=586396 RepID=A0AAV0J023_9ROSI|nr:unnamed protein product [Linum tenue]CAI0403235.1 unnamed protein product [Linum tenue]